MPFSATNPVSYPSGYNAGALRSLERAGFPEPLVLDALRKLGEQANEAGEASHSRYKDRQRIAVKNRLRLGAQSPTPRRSARPPPRK